MESFEVETPFVTIEREKWKKLRDRKKINLTEEQLNEIRGLNENISMKEVKDIYAPLTRLLKVYYDNYMRLNVKRKAFLEIDNGRVPYIIGIAGSVAVGKSTTARILKKLISTWDTELNVYIVPTDGFLYPNAELIRKGIMDKKGFPESYDLKSMIRFLYRVKSGVREIKVPFYSHLKYDIVPREEINIVQPDIILFEGLNVLQSHAGRINDNFHDLMVSDFFDFSIFVDAEEEIIKQWFIQRFLKLKDTAFRNRESYFNKYATIDEQEAIRIGLDIWERINGVNLKMNIERTKYHAQLILRKMENHEVNFVQIRKI
ncbi:MAG: type I pantothenate kinase [Cuniculiplasma sp.]